MRIISSVVFGVFTAAGLANARPGDLDLTFGVNGVVVTDLGAYEVARAVVVQPDGRLLVVGDTGDQEPVAPAAPASRSIALVRYDATGALDATFGTGGIVTTSISGYCDNGWEVALQSDGKIVVVGGSGACNTNVGYNPPNVRSVAVLRYEADGTLDPTFGVGGIASIAAASWISEGLEVAVQPDGKIVVAGYAIPLPPPFQNSDVDAMVLRLDTTGALDPSFGNLAIQTIDYDSATDWFGSVALQTDGAIVVAGCAACGDFQRSPRFALARLDASGQLDPTFGSGGTLEHEAGGFFSWATSMLIDPDGKIVTSGEYRRDGQPRVAIVRFDGTGQLDPTFGRNGEVLGRRKTGDPFAPLVRQSDGKLITADQFFFRLLPNGRRDPTFKGLRRPPVVIANGLPLADQYARDMALQADGKIVVAGSRVTIPQDDMIVVRLVP